jgi:predicted methyltransferase
LIPRGLAAGVDKDFAAGLRSDQRPAEDKDRDAARKPDQVIQFLGIGSGMTVMDVIAGGGYYTEVLSAAVGPRGRVISQNSERVLQMYDGAMARALKTRVDRLDNVDILLASLSKRTWRGG